MDCERAKTGSGRTFDFNGESEEMWVFEIPIAFDSDVWLRLTCEYRRGLGNRSANPSFFRRPAVENKHWTFSIVPISVCVETALNRTYAHGKQRDPLPEFQRAKESLDLAIESLGIHSAFGDFDAQLSHSMNETGAELAAMIRDEESRSAMLACAFHDQTTDVICLRSIGVNAKRQQLPAVSVQDGSDVEAHPHEFESRQVEVPRSIDRLRTQNRVRRDGFGRDFSPFVCRSGRFADPGAVGFFSRRMRCTLERPS
jgi:hypothetical protein